MAEVRKRIVFYGRVQGVGFRYTAKRLAQSLGLTGWAKNEYDGTLVMEIQGREPMIYKLMEGLNHNMFITIEWIDTEEIPVEPESCFYVR
ncbi:acylphosphatase [Dorea sp. YH-dor228]|uniref:acylphosphatase n=1 Tax=Dorea sp. YH-dor228 TaxID=3151120 RepID=UPI0032427949